MRTNLSNLALAYLTIERNPPPYYTGDDRIRENISPEFTNLKKRLRSISLITSWKMCADTNERLPGPYSGTRVGEPLLKKVTASSVQAKIIQPARKLFKEFGAHNYFLVISILLLGLGIMILYATL